MGTRLRGACKLTQMQTYKLGTASTEVKVAQFQAKKVAESNAGPPQVEDIASDKAAT